jgi:hypothetical protein
VRRAQQQGSSRQGTTAQQGRGAAGAPARAAGRGNAASEKCFIKTLGSMLGRKRRDSPKRFFSSALTNSPTRITALEGITQIVCPGMAFTGTFPKTDMHPRRSPCSDP